jgi:5'-deoxynucleotidase YfbR-like HD superfamily hydrolase
MIFEKIFKGEYLKRLDNIKQWSEKDVFKKESVSQHSYKVAIFTRLLLDNTIVVINKDEIDDKVQLFVDKFILDCTTYALFHDWDESLLLRDISHETKYNDWNGNALRKELDSLSHHLAIKEFNDEDENSKLVIKNIECNNSNIKSVVKLCDWLAMEFYCEEEILLGNKNFLKICDYCVMNLNKAALKVNNMFSSLLLGGICINYKTLNYLINYKYNSDESK